LGTGTRGVLAEETVAVAVHTGAVDDDSGVDGALGDALVVEEKAEGGGLVAGGAVVGLHVAVETVVVLLVTGHTGASGDGLCEGWGTLGIALRLEEVGVGVLALGADGGGGGVAGGTGGMAGDAGEGGLVVEVAVVAGLDADGVLEFKV
jgi:hypothetical protein